MEATLFSTFLDMQLFPDDHSRAFLDQIEQLDHVGIAHPNAAVAVRPANRIFMLGPVNIDETIAGVGIALFHSIQPENS